VSATARPVRTEGDPREAAGEAASEAPVEREHAARRDLTLTRIAPVGPWPPIDWRELWAYRGLFGFLVWRGIKVRYAQTVFGVAWAVLQPVMTMVVFTVVFGRFARLPSDGAPYAVFSLAALVLWGYFSASLTGAGNSLLANTNLVTKVYFPRLVIPWSPVAAALVDFSVAFAVALLVLLAHGIVPRPESLAIVPLLLIITAMAATGVGSALAALTLQYRDARFLTPFLVQLWMYASPIVYPASMVPEQYRWAYMLNPMTPVITTFRAVLLGTTPIPWGSLAGAFVVSAALLLAGARYFRRTERVFADVA
jgi:lipopolysaccharide transport system permease protein